MDLDRRFAWCKPLLGRLRKSKQPEVNGVRHRFVASRVQVQVVSWIVLGECLRRVIRVTDRRVEIEDRVVGLAGSNPLVERLALCFSLGRPVIRTLKME